MEAARAAGVRLIVRFAYNWEQGGYDASASRIDSHLDQLKSVFSIDILPPLEKGGFQRLLFGFPLSTS